MVINLMGKVLKYTYISCYFILYMPCLISFSLAEVVWFIILICYQIYLQVIEKGKSDYHVFNFKFYTFYTLTLLIKYIFECTLFSECEGILRVTDADIGIGEQCSRSDKIGRFHITLMFSGKLPIHRFSSSYRLNNQIALALQIWVATILKQNLWIANR